MAACLRNLAAARDAVEGGKPSKASMSKGRTSRRRTVRAARIRATRCARRISSEFRRWQDAARGLVRIVTLSPEWPESPRYIERVTGAGVVASIGHTAATAEQISKTR